MLRTLRHSAPLAGVLLLAAALRFVGLDRQLWLDEIDALVLSQRRPPASIVSQWPPGASGLSGAAHVFYDLLAHANRRALGERPLAVRLPAAVFGVAAVALLFVLARSRFSRAEALAAAFLLAVSVPHVFQSQNARGYTTLLALGLLASWLLLQMPDREDGRWVWAVAYAIAVALAAWAVPFGVFVPAGHLLAVMRGGRSRSEEGRAPWPLWSLVVAFGLAALLIVLAYAPLVGRTLAVAAEQGRLPTPGGGALYRLGVLRTGFRGLSEVAGGTAALTVLLGLTAWGLGRWWRQDRTSFMVLAFPVGLQAAVLLALDVPLNPRYFILALGVSTLGLAKGLASVAGALGRRWPKSPDFALVLLLAIVALGSLPAFVRFYRVPKQDFQGAIARVRARAGPEDRLVAVHHAGRALQGFYRAGFEDVQTLARLEEVEAQGQRILLVATLERFLAAQVPQLAAHIKRHYRPFATLEGTVGGAEVVLYERAPSRGGSLSHP